MPLVSIGGRPSTGHITIPARNADVVIVPAIGADASDVASRIISNGDAARTEIFSFAPKGGLSVFEYSRIHPEYWTKDGNIINVCASMLLDDLLRITSQNHPNYFLHLVGHSTGGLIVKRALTLAYRSQQYNSVVSACNSVAFFATPHQGSSILADPLFSASIQDVLGLRFEMTEKLRDILSPESEEIRILHYDFVGIARRLQRIWTFVELDETPLKVLAATEAGDTELDFHYTLVDIRSAVLRMGNERVLRISRRHGDLLDPFLPRHLMQMFPYGQDLNQIKEASNARNNDLELELKRHVEVDLHLFYEEGPTDKAQSVKIWSVYSKLEELLANGPVKCFESKIGYPLTTSSPSATPSQTSYRKRPPPTRRPSIASVIATEEQAKPGAPEPPAIKIITATPPTSPPDSPKLEARRESVHIPDLDSIEEKMLTELDDEKASERLNAQPHATATELRLKQYFDINMHRQSLRPSLPDASKRKFRWIHTPFNVLRWVSEIMNCLAAETTALRPYETMLLEQNFEDAPSGSPLTGRISDQLCLFIPYLHWDTFKGLQQRARVIRECTSSDPKARRRYWFDSNGSLEMQVIRQYLKDSSNLPLHHRRSLDQYGYPNLRNTQDRDIDQILYKCTKKPRAGGLSLGAAGRPSLRRKSLSTTNIKRTRLGSDNTKPIANEAVVPEEDGKVIMVDQLWIWVTDMDTCLTFFPRKESESDEQDSDSSADLRNSIFGDVNGDPRFATQCHNVFDFVALVVSHAVRVFLERVTDEDLQVLRVFEEYISILTERHTRSFKRFRARYQTRGVYRMLHSPTSDTSDILSSMQQEDLQENENDLTDVLELRDVEDELGTIDKLFKDQLRVIEGLISNCFELRSDCSMGLQLLQDTKAHVIAYHEQVCNMLENCRTAQDAFTRLLDMKQKQANVWEAFAARQANEVASGQSRAVLIFTIFTIIFLPLSFFTSLFGMNASTWSQVSTNPPLHIIFLWMFPVSAVVTISALLIAFNEAVRQLAINVGRAVGNAFRGRAPLRKNRHVGWHLPAWERPHVAAALSASTGPLLVMAPQINPFNLPPKDMEKED